MLPILIRCGLQDIRIFISPTPPHPPSSQMLTSEWGEDGGGGGVEPGYKLKNRMINGFIENLNPWMTKYNS